MDKNTTTEEEKDASEDSETSSPTETSGENSQDEFGEEIGKSEEEKDSIDAEGEENDESELESETEPEAETDAEQQTEKQEGKKDDEANMDTIPHAKGRQDPSQGRNWYAIHTYSGYEDAVEKALRLRIETLNMQDKIFDVLVPKEKEIVMRRGKPIETKKCLFPGYVLVDMIVTDDSWYVVRNTPNVTGFVGSGNIPVPVTLEEFGLVKNRMGSDEPKFKADFQIGDIVKIISGPFATFEGNVDLVDVEKGKLTVLVSIFDRETPVELDFNQVTKK